MFIVEEEEEEFSQESGPEHSQNESKESSSQLLPFESLPSHFKTLVEKLLRAEGDVNQPIPNTSWHQIMEFRERLVDESMLITEYDLLVNGMRQQTKALVIKQLSTFSKRLFKQAFSTLEESIQAIDSFVESVMNTKIPISLINNKAKQIGKIAANSTIPICEAQRYYFVFKYLFCYFLKLANLVFFFRN